jgi:hypothetical protein
LLNGHGEFSTVRCGNGFGFGGILKYISTGVLSFDELNRDDKYCVYSNLKYFKIVRTRNWDFNQVEFLEDVKYRIHAQIIDNRLVCREFDKKTGAKLISFIA